MFFVGCLVAGALALAMGLIANSRYDPDTVSWGNDSFSVKRHQLAHGLAFDFVRRSDGVVLATVAGSTDLVCEPPHLIVINVDQDPAPEVYFTTCDESGFVDHQDSGSLAVVELGEQDSARLDVTDSFWFREIQNRGRDLLFVGALGVVLGLIGPSVTVLSSRRASR